MGGLEWTLLTRRRCRVIAGPGTGDVTFAAGTLSQPSHPELDTLRALSYRQAAGRPGYRAAPSVRFARAVQMSGLGLSRSTSRSTTHQPLHHSLPRRYSITAGRTLCAPALRSAWITS